MARASGDRAQTAIDFAIASGVFLVAVTLVLGFIPGMLSPFTTSQDNTIIADRLAGQLGQDLLTEGTSSYRLDVRCTEDFFNGSDAADIDCKYADTEPTDDNIESVLGVNENVNVNVTIESPTGIVSSGGDELAVGDVANTGTVTTAQRVVVLKDESYRLRVRVW